MKSTIFVVVLCSLACYADEASPRRSNLVSTDEKHSTAAVCPVFEIEAGKDQFIRIDFQNTSENVIRYFDNGGVGGMSFVLFRNGKFVPPYVKASMMFLHEKRVRELKPGEFVLHRINPAAKYKNLTPGRYELCFEYLVPNIKKRLDLTLFKYELQTIAYIEVVGEQ